MSTVCLHPEDQRTIEVVEQLGSGYNSEIYVCGVCGVELPGDPTADRADDLAEQAFEMERDVD